MKRINMHKFIAFALMLTLTAGLLWGCGLNDVLNPTDSSTDSPGTTVPSSEPSTLPSNPTADSSPTDPSQPPVAVPVEYSLTGLWFQLDSSYQPGNFGQSFANYYNGQIHVSVNWETMPHGLSDATGYIQSYAASQQPLWSSVRVFEENSVTMVLCSSGQGRYMALGVYICKGMVGRIMAEGTGLSDEQLLIQIVSSGRIVAEEVPGQNQQPENGSQYVSFGGLQLQISDRYQVSEDALSVFCSHGDTGILICFDNLANYPDGFTAQQIAAQNALLYQGVWEHIEVDGSTVRMYDSNGKARILVYYMQGQTLWEVSAGGTFSDAQLHEMCQLLQSAQILV